LRVLINVSHENQTWCKLLLHQKLMIPVISSLIALSLHGPQVETEETNERSARAFDRLCLALGLLTNLVQVDEDAKDMCRETSEFSSCSSPNPSSKAPQSSTLRVLPSDNVRIRAAA
jgi:hypothetical protein